jgi:hypothetical protein
MAEHKFQRSFKSRYELPFDWCLTIANTSSPRAGASGDAVLRGGYRLARGAVEDSCTNRRRLTPVEMPKTAALLRDLVQFLFEPVTIGHVHPVKFLELVQQLL